MNHFNYNANNNILNKVQHHHPPLNSMKYSKSDYDAFKTLTNSNTTNIDKFFNSSVNDLRNLTLGNDSSFMDSLDLFRNSNGVNNNTHHLSYPSLYPHVEIINNNNDMYASLKSSPPSSPTPTSPESHPYSLQFQSQQVQQQDAFNINNNYKYYQANNNNESYSYNTSLGSTSTVTTTLPNASSGSFASSYSHVLSASLANAPGVTITPLNLQQQQSNANLFGYGFYDTTTTTNDLNNTATIQCKLEVSTQDV